MHVESILRWTSVRDAAAVAALLVCAAGSAVAQGGQTARAQISGDGIKGTVVLREVDAVTGSRDSRHAIGTRNVEVVLKVSGLEPGAHGVHLHAVGKCEGPAFESAGGHFDPGPHGMADPDANHSFHMGDLPNLVADAGGQASFTATTSRVTLSPGPLSLFDSDGTAIVIHADPDQGITGAPRSGVSGGPRVACGVIRR